MNSSSDSDRLLLSGDDNTPARTGLARAESRRSTSVMELMRKLSALGISGTPSAPTTTPAKVSTHVSDCQDSQESSFLEDTVGPSSSGVEKLRKSLEERLHTDFSRQSRKSLGDEAVGAILEHVDQPGRDLGADLVELRKMRTPLKNLRERKSYFINSPVDTEASSPYHELDESMDEASSSLLDRTVNFISNYTWLVKKAKSTLDTEMSPQEKSEIVRLSLDQQFKDTVTPDQKKRILVSCMQRIDDLSFDHEEIDLNNNDVEEQKPFPQQLPTFDCVTLSDSPFVGGEKHEAFQNSLEILECPSEEVVELDSSDCLSLYVDSTYLDVSSEVSKEDSSNSEVEILEDFRKSPSMDQMQPQEGTEDSQMNNSQEDSMRAIMNSDCDSLDSRSDIDQSLPVSSTRKSDIEAEEVLNMMS